MVQQGDEASNGCISNVASWTGENNFMSFYDKEEHGRNERQFPVSCVFHLIVTGCYFFMKMGMDQCHGNVAAMEKLRQELIDSKNITTSKSGSGSRKKLN